MQAVKRSVHLLDGGHNTVLQGWCQLVSGLNGDNMERFHGVHSTIDAYTRGCCWPACVPMGTHGHMGISFDYDDPSMIRIAITACERDFMALCMQQ